MERGPSFSFPLEIMIEFWTGHLMRCAILSKQMVSILSEYLVSVRVVDYSSLGLLSENKIEKQFVSVSTFLLVCGTEQSEPTDKTKE